MLINCDMIIWLKKTEMRKKKKKKRKNINRIRFESDHLNGRNVNSLMHNLHCVYPMRPF